MSCEPGADQFIEDHFKDCVYNVRDYVGFCLGLAAIVFWVVAQIPQYYRNYKTKSAEALSPWFLAQWLLGDTFNLIGALLQGQQLPTTVYTAMYFVIADMFMMMQFIYYGALQRRREQVLKLQARRRHHRRHHHHHNHNSSRSRERDALLGPQAAAGDAAGAPPLGGLDQQQQDLGQSSAWPAQQERRRVPHQTASQQQQQRLGSEQPVAAGASTGLHEAARRSSMDTRATAQPGQQARGTGAAPVSGQSSDTDSSSDSDCSTESGHSSSKGLKRLSKNGSPSRGPCDAAAAAAATLPAASCAAAAAAAPGFTWGAPVIRVPFGDLHWGGVRSVVAVAVLVCMGMVSLLPASTARGMVPVSWSGGEPALQPPSQQGGSDAAAAARAMQAGWQQQQQGSSIHLEPGSQLGSSPKAGGDVGSIDSSSSSSSKQHGWARQGRVGMPGAERDWLFIVGTGLGYVASVLYLCSRMSQIHKNYSRKSSEGLALVMFIMAVCANLCTGTSILFRTFTLQELQEQLPWIIGSLGTISLDMVILWQSTVYGKDGHHQQQQPGGGGDGAPGHGVARHHHHHHHRDGHERQALLHHTAVDVAGADDSTQSAGGAGGQESVLSGAAVLDGMPLAPHHRGGLLGRRHAAAAGGEVGPVDAVGAAPLAGSSIQHV